MENSAQNMLRVGFISDVSDGQIQFSTARPFFFLNDVFMVSSIVDNSFNLGTYASVLNVTELTLSPCLNLQKTLFPGYDL